MSVSKPDSRYPFYFAIPRNATKASREKAPFHIGAEFGVSGDIEHVRSEAAFHLCRVVSR